MASVMLFPNVATHRRMPHLSKEPKETTSEPTVAISVHQQQTTVLPPHSSATPPSSSSTFRTDNINNNNNASKAIAPSSSSTPQQLQVQSSSTGKDHLTLSATTTITTTTPSGNSNNTNSDNSKQVTSGASSSSSLPVESAGGHFSTTPSTSESAVSTPLADSHHHHSHHHLNSQDHESSLHGHENREHPPQLHLSFLQHNQHQQQPLNAPHGSCLFDHPSSSSSSSPFPHAAPLPPSGTTSTSPCPSATTTSATHESRPIKSALYDAFGCLFHPIQCTHTPCSPSGLCGQAGKLAMCAAGSSNSQAQAQAQGVLRSGEVTPLLISPSPRAMSPMLRPHLGPSAPITPLELSSEDGSLSHSHGHGAAGYFGIVHSHGSVSTSSRQLHQHQHIASNHYYTRHHHSLHGHEQQQQHPLPPVPPLLSRTGSFSKHKPQHQHIHEDTFLHSQHHHDSSVGSNTSSSLLSRKSSLGDIYLDPTEHPVLCSLQTLSLTHPHPANHYHPHLGHDLGHDRVSISDPDLSNNSTRGMTTVPLTPSGVLSKTGPKA